VNECAPVPGPCSANGTCTNAPGSYACGCNTGFAGDGKTCTNIDECTSGANNCDVNATCTDTVGSFTCACNFPYVGDGVTCTL
jgi:hypothetical protein